MGMTVGVVNLNNKYEGLCEHVQVFYVKVLRAHNWPILMLPMNCW